jgi:hypothetical protein
MPKHYIYPNPNPDGTDARGRIELHWQRDTYVQVATTRFAGQGQVDTTITYLAEQGPRTEVNEPALAWPGEYVELDRQQVNHLIRQLRIARDQAFGKDE